MQNKIHCRIAFCRRGDLVIKRGQGTFEYILLLAGLLLIVVFAIVLLRGGLFAGSDKSVKITTCQQAIARLPYCYDQGIWTANPNLPLGVNWPTAECNPAANLPPADIPFWVSAQTCGPQPGQ